LSSERLKDYVRQSIEKIRTSLLDLSRRNRLLNFKASARSLTIVDELPNQVLKQLVHEGKSMTLVPMLEPDLLTELTPDPDDPELNHNPNDIEQSGINGIDLAEELPIETIDAIESHYDDNLQTKLFMPELETKLRRIRSDARSVIEETGRNQLYIAIGFLRWKEHDSEDAWNEAPLILIPIELQRTIVDTRSGCYQYNVKFTDDDIISNLCLKEKLERDFGLALPLIEPTNGSEDDELVAGEYLSLVSEAISDFKEWSVSLRIVVSFFSFAKLLMFIDLDEKEWGVSNSLTDHPIINSLLLGADSEADADSPLEKELDENEADSQYPLVLEADSSQLEAIATAATGNNLVVHGPPGTGKSQTITNLVAHYLFSGKSVVFMSDKLAALNVVQRNLEKVGLSDFCLELHSHKVNKNRVLSALRKRIDRIYRTPRDIDENIAYLKSHRELLGNYVRILHTVHKGTQKTLFEIIGRCEILQTRVARHPGLRVTNVEHVTAQSIEDGRSQLELIARFASRTIPPWSSAWKHFSASDLYVGDEEIVEEALSSARSNLHELEAGCKAVCDIVNVPWENTRWSLLDCERISKLEHLPSPELKQEELIHGLLSKFDLKFQKEIDKLREQIASRVEHLSTAHKVSLVFPQMKDEGFQTLSNSVRAMWDVGLEYLTIDEMRECQEVAVQLHKVYSRAMELLAQYDKSGIKRPQSLSAISSTKDILIQLRMRPNLIKTNHFMSIIGESSRERIDKAFALSEFIDIEANRLSTSFSLNDIPQKIELSQIRQNLRKHRKNRLRFVFREYRLARKQLLSFYKEDLKPTHPKLLDTLEDLDKYISAKSEFDHLGSGDDSLSQLLSFSDCTQLELKKAVSWWDGLVDLIGDYNSAEGVALIDDSAVSQLPEADIHSAIESEYQQYSELVIEKFPENHPLSDCVLDRDARIIDLLEKLSSVDRAIGILSNAYSTCGIGEDVVGSLSACDLLLWVDSVEAVSRIDEEIQRNHAYAERLGPYFVGADTDIESVQNAHDWCQRLHALELPEEIEKGLLGDSLVFRLDSIRECANGWSSILEATRASLSLPDQFGKMDWVSTIGADYDKTPLTDLNDGVFLLEAEVKDLPSIADYVRTRKRAVDLNLEEYVKLIEQGQVAPERAADQWELTVLSRLAQSLIARSPVLSNFTSEEHDITRKKFVDIDLTIQHQNTQKVAAMASQTRAPIGIGRGPVRDWTELSLIQRETIKSRRHIPIRQLMKRSGTAIKTLTPVLMMSPLSVAQFIEPRSGEYDVLIMDEASQIRPEEALGAIARAKQVVVVGDPKQLPPTSFFHAATDSDDGEEETTADDTDSILDLCIATNMRQRYLRWHYRSEHESLIAFSNSNWYDGKLVVFPATDQSNLDLGLIYKYVENGKYSDGKNELEARTVALAVFEHLRSCPDLSLGVGTFGIKQQQLIEDQIERLAKRDPMNRDLLDAVADPKSSLEPLFVKNLENIQGDERDVIIVSTTYGPDRETGKVYQRFGPINSKHGTRRLNVLFTRARKRMEIYSSMTPDDIQVGPGRSQGAIALSRFLTYAKTGILTDLGETTAREPDSEFELAVAHTIHSYGFETTLQLGVSGFFIDVAIKDPDRPGMYLLAVECDGATYHSSRFARDRDRLKDEVLKRRGWEVFRIWSTDWFKNRDSVTKRLLSRIDELRKSRLVTVASVDRVRPAEKKVEIEEVVAIPISDKALSERLRAYSQQYSGSNRIDSAHCLLSDEMLTALVKHRPTDTNSFRQKIPFSLRQKIDPDDLDILDDMIGIIERGNNHVG